MTFSDRRHNDPLSEDALDNERDRSTSSAPVAPLTRFSASSAATRLEATASCAAPHGLSTHRHSSATTRTAIAVHAGQIGADERRTPPCLVSPAGPNGPADHNGSNTATPPITVPTRERPGDVENAVEEEEDGIANPRGMLKKKPAEDPVDPSSIADLVTPSLDSGIPPPTPSSSSSGRTSSAAVAVRRVSSMLATSLGSSTVTSLDCSVSLPQSAGLSGAFLNMHAGAEAPPPANALSPSSSPGSLRQRRHNPYGRSFEDPELNSAALTLSVGSLSNVKVPPTSSAIALHETLHPLPVHSSPHAEAPPLHLAHRQISEHSALSSPSSCGSFQGGCGARSSVSSPVGQVQGLPSAGSRTAHASLPITAPAMAGSAVSSASHSGHAPPPELAPTTTTTTTATTTEGELVVHERSAIRVVIRHSANSGGVGAAGGAAVRAVSVSGSTSLPLTRDTPSPAKKLGQPFHSYNGGAATQRSVDDVFMNSGGDWNRGGQPLSPLPLSAGPLSCSASDDHLMQEEYHGGAAAGGGGAAGGGAGGFYPWWGSLSSPSLRGRGGSAQTSAATSRAASSNSSHLVRDTFSESAAEGAEFPYTPPGPSVPVPAASSAFRLSSHAGVCRSVPTCGPSAGPPPRPTTTTTATAASADWQPPVRQRTQVPHSPHSHPSAKSISAGGGHVTSNSTTTTTSSSSGDARLAPDAAAAPTTHSYLPTVDVQENSTSASANPFHAYESYPGPEMTNSHNIAGQSGGASAGPLSGRPPPSGMSTSMNVNMLNPLQSNHQHHQPLPCCLAPAAALPASSSPLSTSNSPTTTNTTTLTTTGTSTSSPTPMTTPFSARGNSSLQLGNVSDRRSGRTSGLGSSGRTGSGSGNDAPLSLPLSASACAHLPVPFPHPLPRWGTDPSRVSAPSPLSSGAQASGGSGGSGGPPTMGTSTRRERGWSSSSASTGTRLAAHSAHSHMYPTPLTSLSAAPLSPGSQDRFGHVYVDDYAFDRQSSSMNFEDPASGSLSSGPNYSAALLFSAGGGSSDEERTDPRGATPRNTTATAATTTATRTASTKLPVPDAWGAPISLVSPSSPSLSLSAPITQTNVAPAPPPVPTSSATFTGRGHGRRESLLAPQHLSARQPHQQPHSQPQHQQVQYQHQQQHQHQHQHQHQYQPQPQQQPYHQQQHYPQQQQHYHCSSASSSTAPAPLPQTQPGSPVLMMSYPVNAHVTSTTSTIPTTAATVPTRPVSTTGAGVCAERAAYAMPSSVVTATAAPPPLSGHFSAQAGGMPLPHFTTTHVSENRGTTYEWTPTGYVLSASKGERGQAPPRPTTQDVQGVTARPYGNDTHRGRCGTAGQPTPHSMTVASTERPVPSAYVATYDLGRLPAYAGAAHPSSHTPSSAPSTAATPPVMPRTAQNQLTREHVMDASNTPTVPTPSPGMHTAGGRPSVDPRVAAGSAPTVTSDALIELTRHSSAPRCPPGWHFSVYNFNMDQHYSLPSENVLVTQGAIKYLQLFERHGMQTRFRFQLCRRFVNHKCDQGTQCLYIHASVPLNVTRIHINENTLTATQQQQQQQDGRAAHGMAGGINTREYPTLEPGFAVEVRAPNQGTEPPQRVPSEMILRTRGSESLVPAESAADPTRRMADSYTPMDGRGCQDALQAARRPLLTAGATKKVRHCAHFQFKGVCNLGEECSFIHSLVPYVQTR